MSSHAFPIDPRVPTLERFAAITAALRAPAGVSLAADNEVYTFTPDLTAAELATVQGVIADLTGSAHTRDLSITLAEFQAIKAQLAEIRAFRQRSLATWNGLTAAQREADEISYLNDLTDVLRALLRQ